MRDVNSLRQFYGKEPSFFVTVVFLSSPIPLNVSSQWFGAIHHHNRMRFVFFTVVLRIFPRGTSLPPRPFIIKTPQHVICRSLARHTARWLKDPALRRHSRQSPRRHGVLLRLALPHDDLWRIRIAVFEIHQLASGGGGRCAGSGSSRSPLPAHGQLTRIQQELFSSICRSDPRKLYLCRRRTDPSDFTCPAGPVTMASAALWCETLTCRPLRAEHYLAGGVAVQGADWKGKSAESALCAARCPVCKQQGLHQQVFPD